MTLPGVFETFGYDFMQRALVAGILVAVVCTLIGVFTVLRGLALISDGLAHISFAGIALGLVLNLFPLEFALAAGVIGAVGIQFVRERGWVKSDVAIGLFFTGGLAFGVALISRARGFNANVSTYLFGSILTVSRTELILVISLSLALGLAVAAFYKELVYMAFNEEAARVAGLPVRGLNLAWSVASGLAVVLASRIVGVLLVSALIIVPAASALQARRSFRTTLLLASVIAVLSVVLGLYGSFALDIAPGAAIALASLAAFLIVVLARRVRRSSA